MANIITSIQDLNQSYRQVREDRHQDMVGRLRDLLKGHRAVRRLMSIPRSSRKVHRINIPANIHLVRLAHLMDHLMDRLMGRLMGHLMVHLTDNRMDHPTYHHMVTDHRVHKYYFFHTDICRIPIYGLVARA